MDLPNEDTLKVIKERQEYLINKSEKSSEKNGFLLMEIKALDRVINLIKLFQNNIPNEFKQKISEIDIAKNKETPDDDKNYTVLYSYEQETAKNSKLDISFIEDKSSLKKYTVIALKKYKENLLKWVYQGKIKTTPLILQEILEKSKTIYSNASEG